MFLKWNFDSFQSSRSKDIIEIVKHGHNMAQTWPLYGPNNLMLKCIPLFGMHDSPVKIVAISGI